MSSCSKLNYYWPFTALYSSLSVCFLGSFTDKQGRRLKIFQGWGQRKKHRKLAKYTEKWHYLASSRVGNGKKDRKIAKKAEK